MRTRFALLLALLSLPASAAAAPAAHPGAREENLGKKGKTALDTSLAGNITRKKSAQKAAPALLYDQFTLGIELQVTEKRHEQIESLKKIIQLSPADSPEMPDLLFRLGELYWEESRSYFFEANRKDDDLIRAMNANDKGGEERARAEKADLLAKSTQFSGLAVNQYTRIVTRYRDYARMDEVLFFLGHNLMDNGQDRKALVVYERLIQKYPQSKYIPDAYLAFGEYFFNTSKGNHPMLQKALMAYQRAAAHPENQVYAFALYKEGWVYFNLSQFDKAMDMFKSVVLYGQLAGAKAVERDAGKSGKATLVREARKDYVRAYERVGAPLAAKADFAKLAGDPNELYSMLKGLAGLYYDDGKDREAALMYNELIREHPLSPEAPGFQGRIVDCILRAGNKRMTVAQVRRLVKIIHDVEASGQVKDDKGKQELKDARELSERTLSNLAVNWHKEAKKTRDDETFQLADEVYSDYLTLFPDNPKAYDLRFFRAELLNDNLQKYDVAAQEYTRVFEQDIAHLEKHEKPGRWMVNAAYDAVLANDEVVKLAEQGGKVASQAQGTVKAVPIPKVKQDLLDACLRYLKYLPQGEKRVEIEFKAANIYYRFNHFDEAVKRFSHIALNDPGYKFENGDKAGEVSANLVLDSYNLLKDWAHVNEWARKFYNAPGLAQGQFKDDLAKVIEQSSFKLVSQMEQEGEYGKAAEAYLDFVKDFPKTQIADKAIYNAATDFYKAHRLDKAIGARDRLIRHYPHSTFVPELIYANAEAYEALGQFEHAIDSYEAYVRGFQKGLGSAAKVKKKDKKHRRGKKQIAQKAETDGQVYEASKAQIALYDAGVFHEGLGELKAALRDRELYLELWPNTKDAEKVGMSIIDLYEKMGAWTKAANGIEQHERDHVRDAEQVMLDETRLYHLYADKLHKARDAERILRRASKYYDKLPHRLRDRLDGTALELVARGLNEDNEEQFRWYATRKLKWGRMPHPEVVFKKSLKDKATSLQEIQKLYTKTVKLKAAEPAICALWKIGLAYENFANTLINAPPLRGAPPEFQDTLKQQMEGQAEPVKNHAADFFAAAVAKAREFEVKNDCSRASLKALRDTYRPDQYGPKLEQSAKLVVAEAAPQVQAPPLLTEIEKVTKHDLSATPAPQAPPPAEKVAPPPAQATAPASAPAATPAPAQPAAPPPNTPSIAPAAREDSSGDLVPGRAPPPTEQVNPQPSQQPAPSKPKNDSDEPKDFL